MSEVNISLSGKMITFNDSISLNQAAQIIAFIDSSNKQNEAILTSNLVQPDIPVQISADAVDGTLKQTPREAIDEANAKTNPERIVVFAKFLHDNDGKDSFTADEIKPMFQRVRETTPKNLSRDMATAIRNGWLDEIDKGVYIYTNAAKVAISDKFSQKISATRRTKKSKKVVEDGAEKN
ncbi:hypothetical protein FWG95_02495 [Candidatus Saccharibacteria bacterium]|nr:hypothetical protein [Candidatus Saccharibacteria bacterium]